MPAVNTTEQPPQTTVEDLASALATIIRKATRAHDDPDGVEMMLNEAECILDDYEAQPNPALPDHPAILAIAKMG